MEREFGIGTTVQEPPKQAKIYCTISDMICIEFKIGKKTSKMMYTEGQEEDMATLLRNFNITEIDTTGRNNRHPFNPEQYLTVCRAILKAYPYTN